MKFRSWNEKLNDFIYFEDGYYSYFGNGVEKYFLLGTDFNDLMVRNGNHYQFDWKNAEQFTGLFDKNGTEIYEGDKVKFSFCSCVGREIPYNFEGVVKFYDGCFWVDNGKKAFLLFMEEVEWEVIEEGQE